MFADVAAQGKSLPRISAVALAIAGISALHYWTAPIQPMWHGIYQHLYYVPVILAAYWYGVPGGLAAATLTAILYVPHITTWTHEQSFLASQLTGLVVFYVTAVVVGLLSSTQQRLLRQYRDTAASLRQANDDLHASFEQLQRSERLASLGEIAAGLAHEVKNPLSAIKGAIEIVQGRATPASPEAEFAAIAVRELARIESLLGDFLTYARPREPRRSPVSIGALIERVLSVLASVAQRADVKLEVAGVGRPLMINVDAEQVSQVLFNVILNAIQAGKPGGRVSVDVEPTHDTVRVNVVDDGRGVPAHEASRIFEPFFTTKAGGTGLGLPIAQRIIAAHGGSIALTSLDGGPGATFRLTLPLAAPPVRPGQPAHV